MKVLKLSFFLLFAVITAFPCGNSCLKAGSDSCECRDCSRRHTAMSWWNYIRNGDVKNHQSLFKIAREEGRMNMVNKFLFSSDRQGQTLLDVAVNKNDQVMVRLILLKIQQEAPDEASIQFALRNAKTNFIAVDILVLNEDYIVNLIRTDIDGLTTALLMRAMLEEFIRWVESADA